MVVVRGAKELLFSTKCFSCSLAHPRFYWMGTGNSFPVVNPYPANVENRVS
jgi:hypothetical protein